MMRLEKKIIIKTTSVTLETHYRTNKVWIPT
jgi:hypothetical protein